MRFVHLEDDPNDRELVAAQLYAELSDCRIEAVATRTAFEQALADPPDLILADYSLPGFGGDAAQKIAMRRCPDVPFLFVSGSIGEEQAVEAVKLGATDYVLKHHLDKLPMAVRRALREAEERRQRTAAEAALRELNAELEARVEERTRALMATNKALQAARREADRANQAKSDFLSRMSHELRTPLNAILGFGQVLQLDPLSPDQTESVTQILRGGQHLLNLINEVLDIARIEAGALTLSPEPVAVSDVVDEAVAIIQPLAAQRGISICVDAPAGLNAIADRQRLTQVLLNLLSNAVKYNRPGGRVAVRARRDPMRVAVEVTDTGPGIRPEKMAMLFTPFERLGAETSPIEGTGLGLTLAKSLAEAMGGALGVESVVDEGTTFRLTLPASEAAPVLEDRSAELPAARRLSGTVLYIEDNASNAQLMRRLLERRPGATLLYAPDGHTGLERIRSERPDLVILDLHLSDMSGEEVLRHIWEDPATRSIPVAVLSADATRDTQRRVLASGAVRYLTKPFAIADVLQLIDDILGLRT